MLAILTFLRASSKKELLECKADRLLLDTVHIDEHIFSDSFANCSCRSCFFSEYDLLSRYYYPLSDVLLFINTEVGSLCVLPLSQIYSLVAGGATMYFSTKSRLASQTLLHPFQTGSRSI